MSSLSLTNGRLRSGAIIDDSNRAHWLAERRKSIGASEAASAVGANPWDTPIDLWQRKTGRAAETEENEAMRWGSLLEPLILSEYEERTGRRVASRQLFVRHPDHPHLTATLDGVAYTPDVLPDDGRIVEAKTASAWAAEWGDPETDQVPDQYLVQVHQQMFCYGIARADVAVLIGGQRLRIYSVERNDTLMDAMRDRLDRFWWHVQNDTPPDWGRVTAQSLLARNPACSGEIELSDALETVVADYERVNTEVKFLEDFRENAKLEILAALGSAEVGNLPSGRRIKRFVQTLPERTQTVHEHTRHFFKVLKGHA